MPREPSPRPRELPPPPALASRIEAFWHHEGSGGSIRVLPDGCMDFWFDLESGAARVIGSMTEAALVRVPAGGRYFGVRFRPGVAAEYVTDTMRAFVDGGAALAEATRALPFALAERVAAAPAHAARIAVIAEFVRASASRVRAADHRVTRAVALLRNGAPSIRGVAAELGVSERQLERLFAERIGSGPKHFARVVRLERAVRLMGTPLRGQAALAAAAGYADEPHLIREFRALACATPSELARERRVGFVQGG